MADASKSRPLPTVGTLSVSDSSSALFVRRLDNLIKYYIMYTHCVDEGTPMAPELLGDMRGLCRIGILRR